MNALAKSGRGLSSTRRTAVRGVTLVEALVALAVMAFGMLALVGVQANLRRGGEFARQMTEASRRAIDDLEQARIIDSLDSATPASRPWARIGPATTTSAASTTSFSMVRRTQEQDLLPASGWSVAVPANVQVSRHKIVESGVSWTDRQGLPGELSLLTLIGANDPRLSLALVMDLPSGAPAQVQGRSPALPPGATSIPEVSQRQVWFQPNPNVADGFILNRLTGEPQKRCMGRPADLHQVNCQPIPAGSLLLSGTIAFDGRTVTPPTVSTPARLKLPGGPPQPPRWTCEEQPDPNAYGGNALPPRCPLGPVLPLAVQPLVFNPGINQTQAPLCVLGVPYAGLAAVMVAADERKPAVASQVDYYCIVRRSDDRIGWGGRLELSADTTAWTIATSLPTAAPAPDASGLPEYRVCRYTPLDSPYARNADHPDTYCQVESSTCTQKVTGPLAGQNFLVIRSHLQCPVDAPVDVTLNHLRNYNTVAHQPATP